LSAIGIEYPKTHDLRALLSLLDEQGCEIGKLWHFVEFNAYAVQFRYGAYDSASEPLDRMDVCKQVQSLLQLISNHIK